MVIVVDECLPWEAFRSFLESRGHEVLSVGNGFVSGAKDEAISVLAEMKDAVVFSSDTDWKRLIKRVGDEQGSGVAKRAGRVLFTCTHPEAAGRMKDLIESIEFEHAVCSRQGIPLIMTITQTLFRIDR